MDQNGFYADANRLSYRVVGELAVQDRFVILGDLGGGAYGTVYKAMDNADNGKIVALKKMSVQEDPDVPGYPPFVMREVANLNRLSSSPDKHIIRYVKLMFVTRSIFDKIFGVDFVH